MALTTVNSGGIKDDSIVNADIKSDAAIAGSKISPDFGSQNIVTTGTASSGDLTLTSTAPKITFTDSNNDPDFLIQNSNGAFVIFDATNSATRLTVNADGHIDIAGNTDFGAGVDVTGNITVTGTVDGVDIAALNTTVGTKAVLTGSTNNTIATVSGANALVGEANLTFDGTLLKLQCDSGEFRVEAANGVDAFSVDSDNGNTVIAGELDLTGKCLTSFGGNSTNEASCIKVGYEGSSKGQIRVYGADASTTGSLEFKVCESDGSDDHVILMNQKGSLLVGSTAQYGANAKDLADGGLAITSAGENGLKVLDSTASAANVGGAILLGGNYRSDGDTQPFVELKSFKHNSTNADYTYGFKIGATVYGASITDRYIVHSEGTVDHEFKTRTGAGILDLFNNGNVNISDGNLIVANGHGIDFSAQTATSATGASTSSELLDHYEEGSWTPTFGSSGSESGQTYSNQLGEYTKIGNMVHCRFRLNLTDKGSTTGTYIMIKGLPFTIESSPPTLNLGILYFVNLADSWIYLGLQGAEGASSMYIWGKDSAGTARSYPNLSDIGDNTELACSFSYAVN